MTVHASQPPGLPCVAVLHDSAGTRIEPGHVCRTARGFLFTSNAGKTYALPWPGRTSQIYVGARQSRRLAVETCGVFVDTIRDDRSIPPPTPAWQRLYPVRAPDAR